jgi:hypothetical protein
MAKQRVTFSIKRITADEWQIIAKSPGVEDRFIKGLNSKEDCDDWLSGDRKIDWLRSQGLAK